MKKMLLFIFSCILTMSLFAQSAVVPVGGTLTGEGGTATYTVGQIAVKTIGNGAISVAEGVQQPYEISVVGIDEHPEIVLSAKVYPNPTADHVFLELALDDEQFSGTIRVIDAYGKYIANLQITGPVTEIDLTQFAAGTYYLRVEDHRAVLKTFKVIKIEQ